VWAAKGCTRARYYFDLGPDLYPGFSKGVIALDLILKLPGTLLHQYEALVPTNPVFYKACTSGVAYTFGDFISQLYQVHPPHRHVNHSAKRDRSV